VDPNYNNNTLVVTNTNTNKYDYQDVSLPISCNYGGATATLPQPLNVNCNNTGEIKIPANFYVYDAQNRITGLNYSAIDASIQYNVAAIPINTVSMSDDIFQGIFTGTAPLDKITKVVLNSGSICQEISDSAFEGNVAINNFVFSENINHIKGDAFKGCTALKDLHFLSNTPPIVESTAFDGTNAITNVYVPLGAVNQYKYDQSFLDALHIDADKIKQETSFGV
jgi:hypothetical protein